MIIFVKKKKNEPREKSAFAVWLLTKNETSLLKRTEIETDAVVGSIQKP